MNLALAAAVRSTNSAVESKGFTICGCVTEILENWT